ncbi:MAG: hypothetical protein RLZZ53_1727 [Acidobacteriota bacterium]|jgi:flagellar biogenesis protein FliO
MAEQSFENHTHLPTHTAVAWLLALIALVLWVLPWFGYQTRDWAGLLLILTALQLGWISRVYTVRLQDRIIMLEVKVRAAELLTSGADAQLAKLSAKQIAALRFAGDDEFGALLERAARENMEPKAIKAAVKHWRADLHRT